MNVTDNGGKGEFHVSQLGLNYHTMRCKVTWYLVKVVCI